MSTRAWGWYAFGVAVVTVAWLLSGQEQKFFYYGISALSLGFVVCMVATQLRRGSRRR